MRKLLFMLVLAITSLLFSANEIMHISKVYSDGTPKEVIIYTQVSNDLKSNNPFQIIEKINYDTKGNYIRPKLTGDALIAQSWIVGEWSIGSSSTLSVKFNRDGSYGLYRNGVLDEDESGMYYFEEENDQVVMRVKEIDVEEVGKVEINFNNRNEFTIEFPDGRIDTLSRLK